MPSHREGISANGMAHALVRYGVDKALAREGFTVRVKQGWLGLYLLIEAHGQEVIKYKVNREKLFYHHVYRDQEYFDVFFIPKVVEAARLAHLKIGGENGHYSID